MEFRIWPDTRKAAGLALIRSSPVITSLNLAGCSLNDNEARALASVLGADSKIETLNLERNQLTEVGLKAIVEALGGPKVVVNFLFINVAFQVGFYLLLQLQTD